MLFNFTIRILICVKVYKFFEDCVLGNQFNNCVYSETKNKPTSITYLSTSNKTWVDEKVVK